MSVFLEVCRIIHTVLFLVISCQLLARAKDRNVLGVVRFFDAAVAAVLINNVYSSIDLSLRMVPAAGRNFSGAVTALLLLAAANGELCLRVYFHYCEKQRERRILAASRDKEK